MNVIELVTKYLPLLDEQYRLESKSAILDTAPEFVQQTKNAKKFRIAKLTCDGLGNYSRNGGFTTGSADLTWEEHEYAIDRGRALQIDAEDNEETFNLAFGRLAGTFQKQNVIPEMDATRFAKYYQYAGIKKAIALTTSNVLSTIDDLDADMDEAEVPEEGRVIFCNPITYKKIINDNSIEKFLTVNDTLTKAMNKKIYDYNNHPIIKVPSKRFYTAIHLLDGKSAGQEVGGYEPAENAQIIGLLLVSAASIIQTAKRLISRYWAPTKAEAEATGADGVNPDADAWKFDFRIYHDAWVLDNAVDGVAAVIDTADVSIVAGEYSVEGGTFTEGAPYHFKPTASGLVEVTGELPYKAAEASIGLPAGNRMAAMINNPAIASKNDLPSGVICRVLRSNGEFGEYTKDAFENDGSLIVYANANKAKDLYIEITWVASTVSAYKFDFTNARFEPAE